MIRKSKISYTYITAVTLLVFAGISGCSDDITGEFSGNLPPETSIFVKSPDPDSLNYRESIQTLYWDGRDPDGFIKGFYYTWLENPGVDDWIWTTERSLTFPLEITGADTVYLFQIKAVDNEDVEDPTPAQQLFPIINSPPVIDWIINSRIPDTTFTVASFAWTASDPDGDTTIAFFEYALDTPENWSRIPGTRRNVSIDPDSGLTPGDHVFYLRAIDIAGATSDIIRMPQASTWHVKIPAGRYLLIDDYLVESGTSGFPDAYYRGLMNTLLPAIGESGGYEYWNIEELFPASRQQFTETLKLFDYILWYSDLIVESDDHFIAAQVAIPEFRNQGGKLIYTVQFNQGFGILGEPLGFTPVDSLSTFYNFLAPGAEYIAESDFNQTFGVTLPELQVSTFIFGLISLRPKATSIPLYRYDDPALETDPVFVMIGQNDNSGEYDFVFSGTPLHVLNMNGNLDELFTIIFRDVFTD